MIILEVITLEVIIMRPLFFLSFSEIKLSPDVFRVE